MAPAHKPSRQRQRAELPPLPPRQKGVPRQIDMNPFDENAPIGTYEIDAFAAGIPWRDQLGLSTEAEKVDQLRLLIAGAGRRALEWAHSDMADAQRKADADAHLKALTDLAARARLVAQRNVEPFQYHFAQRPVAEEGTDPDMEIEMIRDADAAAGAALDHIARIARLLVSAIDRFEQKFPVGKAYNPGNRSPLEHRFIEMMGTLYEALTGQMEPSGRTGSYAQLLAAAWFSLGFPDPGPHVDMVETLGRLNEAHSKRR